MQFFEKCYIINSASLIGVRETRHFKGKYTITEDDISEAKIFDDYVVKDAFFNFDVHNITGSGLDKTGVQHNFKQKNGYTIPYRCLLPETKENLLLCGRNISGTHIAHSNLRRNFRRNIKMIKKDCFAYRPSRCNVLTEMICRYGECSFYKTCKQDKLDREKYRFNETYQPKQQKE